MYYIPFLCVRTSDENFKYDFEKELKKIFGLNRFYDSSISAPYYHVKANKYVVAMKKSLNLLKDFDLKFGSYGKDKPELLFSDLDGNLYQFNNDTKHFNLKYVLTLNYNNLFLNVYMEDVINDLTERQTKIEKDHKNLPFIVYETGLVYCSAKHYKEDCKYMLEKYEDRVKNYVVHNQKFPLKDKSITETFDYLNSLECAVEIPTR